MNMNTEKITSEILGMRDLYYANIINYIEFEDFVKSINKKFKLRFEKVIDKNSYEPFTSIKWKGYKGKNCIYSIYVYENI